MTSLLGNGTAKACVVYATVKDGGEAAMTVCGGNGKRLTHVLITDSYVLEVRLIGKLQQSSVADGYFLIKYAGHLLSKLLFVLDDEADCSCRF